VRTFSSSPQSRPCGRRLRRPSSVGARIPSLMSSDPIHRPPRWERAVATALSLWQRLRQAAAVVLAVWQRLGTFDKFRTAIQVLVVIWLLGIMPWHESRFDLRRFVIGILIIARGSSILHRLPVTGNRTQVQWRDLIWSSDHYLSTGARINHFQGILLSGCPGCTGPIPDPCV
jgi:hypothetical protein